MQTESPRDGWTEEGEEDKAGDGERRGGIGVGDERAAGRGIGEKTGHV